MKTVSANDKNDLSVDKRVGANVDVVNVDDIQSEDVSVDKTPGPGIAKRLRSRSGKTVPSSIYKCTNQDNQAK
ncbi:hypothetical protein A2U01_0085467, partial [Trifolium medium]|nr:hypothetical protein [Trifolium medium]